MFRILSKYTSDTCILLEIQYIESKQVLWRWFLFGNNVEMLSVDKKFDNVIKFKEIKGDTPTLTMVDDNNCIFRYKDTMYNMKTE